MVVVGQRHALDGCAENYVPCFNQRVKAGLTVQLVETGYADRRIFRVHNKQNS